MHFQVGSLRRLMAFGLLWLLSQGYSSAAGVRALHDHVPAAISHLTANGRLLATNELSLAIGLPLRDEAGLDQFLSEVSDPGSPQFRKYLTTAEFTARFSPTEADYATVKEFARTNGLVVTGTHSNRLVLDVRGKAKAIERAFHLTLRTFRHPGEARNFFAPDAEPTIDANISIQHIAGLDNFSRPRPMSVVTPLPALKTKAITHAGSGSGGSYYGRDFSAAYVPGTALSGSGQSVALLQFDGYYSNDIAAYISLAGLTNYSVSLSNVAVNGGVATPGSGNVEVCLDIEMVLSMSPAVSKIYVYEAPNGSTAWSTILSQIANDNLAKQIGCSWGNSTPGGKDTVSEGIFKQMAAQGQSFFNASGDSDAFTNGIPFPAESTNITQVGGTILNTTGPAGAWQSESAWNRNNGVGACGGISLNYGIPIWQQGLSMTANHGSTTKRNVPDVAMTAESVVVTYNNGSTGAAGGTSCAAPLWAGFMALVNQQAAASSQPAVGFVNPAVYAIGKSAIYNACFHDTTIGNNFKTTSLTNFPAVTGFDLCTGWGTPAGTNLINALIVPPPSISTQPTGRTVTNGVSVTLTTAASGPGTLSYAWLYNGAALSDGGNIFGATTNVLTITAATTNNSGNYQLVVSNSTGAVISSIAVVNVGIAPLIITPPVSQTNLVNDNVTFLAVASGSQPLAFQWRKSGTNLANGTGIAGVTSNVLVLSGITTNRAGSYTLYATNIYGAITSSVANLTVVLPPSIATSTLTNRTLECGKNTNTFTISTVGTAPLRVQWSLDGTPVPGATNNTCSVTNLHLPNHTLSVVITNLYGTITSNTLLTVSDTLVPVVALNGSNPTNIELGSDYYELGATATDICAGPLPVTVSGSVNTNALGTNTLTYTVSDGSGNTGTATRTVIVRDTAPPMITSSFTNLFLVADANCTARMPSVTDTNYISATDLSGALTISQKPTNNAVLQIGTNVVVITVKDATGNAAFSTNAIIVLDQTPPVILLSGGNLIFTELGAAYVDPGATANDSCVGVVPVTISGAVDTNFIGTNRLTFTADDGRGNTNIATRFVIVRDTTPPVIGWSFMNLTLAADTNCSALLGDVTGTNFILASDLSGPLTFSQSPTNGSFLFVGTNQVIISVADFYGNSAFSTNTIVVTDPFPPVIVNLSPSQTNAAGTTAQFSVTATACTPLSFQWFFNNFPLLAATNSSLILSNVNKTSVGDYFVIVNSAGGVSTSAVATLTVNLTIPTLTLNSSVNPSGFYANLDDTGATTPGYGVYFIASLSPPDAGGTVQFSTSLAQFDSKPVVAGQAISVSLVSLPRGTNLITANYSGDANHLPTMNTFAQIITNHPPVGMVVTYRRYAGFPLSIAVADLATNWTDVDSDVISLADFGTSTNGVMLTNDLGMLVYFNSNNVADQFVCTISDNFGGTNFQSVNIVVLFPQIRSVVPNVDGSLTLNLSGAPASTCVLEAKADLFGPDDWQPIATNKLGLDGLWQFNDSAATNFPKQFYRLKLVQ